MSDAKRTYFEKEDMMLDLRKAMTA